MLYCVSGTGSPMVVNNQGDQGETAYTKVLVPCVVRSFIYSDIYVSYGGTNMDSLGGPSIV